MKTVIASNNLPGQRCDRGPNRKKYSLLVVWFDQNLWSFFHPTTTNFILSGLVKTVSHVFWHPLTSASDGEGEDGCQRGDLQLTWHLCLGAYSPVNKQKLPQSHKLCNFMQKMIETITMKRKHNLNQDQGTTDWVRLGGRWLQQGFYPVWLEFIKGGKYGRRWQSTREYDSEKCAAQRTQPMIRANTEHVKNWTCRRNQTLTSFKDFWIHLPSKNLHGRENLLI